MRNLLLVVVACWSISLASAAEPASQPNLVLIVIDDLGYGDLGCYGNHIHQTPNIDALASGGMRFTDFHTNSPVCSPTRAALMTGQYQQRCGIESAIGFTKDEGMPISKTTVAEMLHSNGYTCSVIGKWHLGHVHHFGPNDQGFDLSYCSNNSPDYHTHVSRIGELDWYKDQQACEESGYLTKVVTDHANDFIEAHKEQPFFLFVSHLAVHFPFQGPSDPPHRTLGKTWHDQKYGPLPPEDHRRAYRDMLVAVDESVGALVKTLDILGLRQRTLIVVTSDNGAYSWVGNNGPYRGQKGDLFEGGHRVPAIFNWPGMITKESVCHEAAMTMDLAPTFLSIAGIEFPRDVSCDGIDISGVLFEKTVLKPRRLFWRFNNSYTDTHAHAVRDGDWKYVEERSETYLFNLASDPSEQTNVANTNQQLVRELHQSYLGWERSVTTDE